MWRRGRHEPRNSRVPGGRRAGWTAVTLLLLLTVSSSCAETLRIATYNLENYCLADRMTPDGFRKEYPKPEEQKRAMRRVIVGLQADILAVQEIGGQTYLDELCRDLRRDGLDYPHVAWVDGPDPERHVALLAKRPIAATVAHDRLEFRYKGAMDLVKRGVLEAHFSTPAGDLAVYVVHLKSRYSDRSDDPNSDQRRLGEALAVRDLILRRTPNPAKSQMVLLGDFNDEKSSAALRRLVRRGSTVLASLVPASDSRGETWTHVYRKRDSYSRVDHVFVSSALKPAVKRGTAQIYDGEGVRAASDHRPVVVTLELDAAGK